MLSAAFSKTQLNSNENLDAVNAAYAISIYPLSNIGVHLIIGDYILAFSMQKICDMAPLFAR